MKRKSVKIEFDVLTQGWLVIKLSEDVAVSRVIFTKLEFALLDCAEWLTKD